MIVIEKLIGKDIYLLHLLRIMCNRLTALY